MGRINAVRLININYNNNSIRINDETLHFNGESTLISLKNGGGKTVLVQIMTAPFVHKRYRNTKDRTFDEFFTTATPSFILIEWSLDGGRGHMMNGFMVRHSQNEEGEGQESLDITGIISEYDSPCINDIHNLPVVEKTSKSMKVKGYAASKQMFDDYKRNRDMVFFSYDMNNQFQQRQYFDKLAEYRIDYREWEDIIKKINAKEGGLSELFSDCRDEKSLTEKWLLESVEKKLDKEGSRVKEFEKITGNYVRQYYENEDKIKRKKNIELFRELVVGSGEGAADTVKAVAEGFKREETEEQKLKSVIAVFSKAVLREYEIKKEKIEENTEHTEQTGEKLNSVKHEKYSYEIKQHKDRQRELEEEYEVLEKAYNENKAKIKAAGEKKELFGLRKLYDKYKLENREWNDINEKLKAKQKEGEDTKPRREELGGMLFAYYDDKNTEIEDKTDEFRNENKERAEAIDLLKVRKKDLEKEKNDLFRKQGELTSASDAYSEKEDGYNKRYAAGLARNIFGRYEEGLLAVEEQSCRDIVLDHERELKTGREKKLSLENKKNRLESEERQAREDKLNCTNKREAEEKELEKLDKEKADRLAIMKYIDLGEDMLYSTDVIEAKLTDKITEIEAIKNTLTEQLTKEKKENEALRTGKIYELPESMKKALTSAGISEMQGLAWLRKNRRSFKANAELVRKNPFLPYALIMTASEYAELKNLDDKLYSSFPVPVILRDDIEKGEYKVAGGSVELDGVSFYVRFNEKLMDEEMLSELLLTKENRIGEIEGKLEIRKTEITDYNNRLGVIRNQHFSRDIYEGTQKKIEEYKAKENELVGLISEIGGEKAGLSEELSGIDRELDLLEKKLELQKERGEALVELRACYESYVSGLKELERIKKDIAKLINEAEEAEEKQESLRDEYSKTERRIDDLKRESENIRKRLDIYRIYSDRSDTVELSDKDRKRIDNYEAEYRALTEEIGKDIENLEKDLEKQAERCQGAKKEYDKKRKKLEKEYDRTSEELEEALDAIRYDEDKESEAEQAEKKLRDKESDFKDSMSELKTSIMLKGKDIENALAEMEKECAKTEPVPDEDIVPRNYEEEIKQLIYDIGKLRELAEKFKEREQIYAAVLSGLAEYDHFENTEGFTYDGNIDYMSKEQLDREKGAYIRDLNASRDKLKDYKEQLEKCIRTVMEKEELRDDYYRKPLLSMLELSGRPDEVLRQIDTTIIAYDELMRKIEVDLKLIDKERASIVGELAEYIKSVHTELSKIDNNSTIKVRDRNLKMLDIRIPDWLSNEELYNIRLREFFDELTLRGVEAFRKGENAAEYFGTKLNTKTLYDTIVGLANVQIKLYKIEGQREYPILWSEVSKNSGGEGFVSTFIILSCLLHYIRKDDSDIFAERNESKVMIMDNPFGITYSDHLLKPMWEMAKKNNTQLICLSGLSGDSIYSRFNNIYVLNGIPVSAGTGREYVKAEHIRGSEPENIVAAQIEVAEQLTLF